MKRPWQGQVEDLLPDTLPAYDPTCYLCPSNPRSSGVTNPAYTHTYVFDNDFPALLFDLFPALSLPDADDPTHLLQSQTTNGICRVQCFSPRHDLTLPEMECSAIRRVIDIWVEQYLDLGARAEIRQVQIFENKGAMMGCSNPHAHCQIFAVDHLSDEMYKEDVNQARYWKAQARSLLADYIALEEKKEVRIVLQNEHFVSLVPYWAMWPFEILLVSRRHGPSIDLFSDAERDALADTLKQTTIRYDNLFEVSFPYAMGLHQQPTDDVKSTGGHPHWHFHIHFYPPSFVLPQYANLWQVMKCSVHLNVT